MVGQFQRFEKAEKNTLTRKDMNMKQTTKSLNLPIQIAAYFTADKAAPAGGGDGFGAAEDIQLGPRPEGCCADVTSLWLLPSDQHDSEASLVSHHASVSFGSICQRNGFDHHFSSFELRPI